MWKTLKITRSSYKTSLMTESYFHCGPWWRPESEHAFEDGDNVMKITAGVCELVFNVQGRLILSDKLLLHFAPWLPQLKAVYEIMFNRTYYINLDFTLPLFHCQLFSYINFVILAVGRRMFNSLICWKKSWKIQQKLVSNNWSFMLCGNSSLDTDSLNYILGCLLMNWVLLNIEWRECKRGLHAAISLDLAVSAACRLKCCISVETYGIAIGKD